MRNKNTLKAMNTIQAGAIKGNDGASNVTKNLVYVSKATPSDVAALQQAHQARSLSFCLIFISAFSSACNRFSIILSFSSAATSSSWNFSAQAAFVFNSAPKREAKTELMGCVMYQLDKCAHGCVTVASHRRCRRLRCFKLQVVPGCKAVLSRALLPTTLFLLTFPEYLQPPSSSHLSSALSISYSSVLLELLDKSP